MEEGDIQYLLWGSEGGQTPYSVPGEEGRHNRQYIIIKIGKHINKFNDCVLKNDITIPNHKNFSSLARHKHSKHDGVSYDCNQCDCQATQQSSLARHKLSKHDGVRYDCDQCDYQATQHSSQTTHKQSKHDEVRYNCYQCDYQATDKRTLVTHKKYKHD